MENYLIPGEGFGPPTDPSPTTAGEKAHPTVRYLRKFVDSLPMLDAIGKPFKMKDGATKPKTGKIKEKDRDYCYKLREDLAKDLPSNPHYATRPGLRALDHRPSNGLWQETNMVRARDEFYIPSGTRVVMVCFEFFDGDIMRDIPSYIKNSHGYKGVMMTCPKCKCNDHVQHGSWSCQYTSAKKCLNQSLTQDIVIAMQYVCHNTASCKGDTLGKSKRGKTFLAYSKECWSLLPDLIKQRYEEFVSDLEDTETQLMLSPGFSDMLLFLDGNFDPFANQIKEAHNLLSRTAATSYRNFCVEETARMPKECPTGVFPSTHQMRLEQKWPAFDEKVILSFFKSPSRNTVIKYWEDIFKRVKPFLMRDLLSRLPGKILRIDGTYEMMKKTMNMPDVPTDNNVLVVVMGEYGHIVIYAFCESERDMVAERLFYYIKKRILRINPSALEEIIAVYSDTCCNNGDPDKHWLPLMFPSCKRAPIKDIWHGIETITRTTVGSSHPLYDSFKGRLWRAVLKHTNQSVREAVACFMKTDPEGKRHKDEHAAIAQMFKKKQWRKRMINFIDGATIRWAADKVTTVFLETEKLDDDSAKRAALEGKSYLKLFTKTSNNTNSLGTKEAVDNFLEHLLKGCFSDPLPPPHMHYPVSFDKPKDGGPPVRNSKRGTNIVETGNLHGRRATLGVATRQRSSLTDSRYLVHVSSHNLMTDDKIEHITGVPARPRDWFVREALRTDLVEVSRTVFETDFVFPPKIDLARHREPIGEEYQLWKHWQEIDREISVLKCQLTGIEVSDGFGDLGVLGHYDLSFLDAPLPTTNLASPTVTPGVAEAPTPVPEAPEAAQLDGNQEEFSARMEARSESPKKKGKTSLLGAERWGIRKAHVGPTTVDSVFLLRLTDEHRRLLHSAHNWAWSQLQELNQPITAEALSPKIVGCFDHWHANAILQGREGGLGGRMRPTLVMEFLKDLGRSAVDQQLESQVRQPVAALPASQAHTLTDAQIDALGRGKAREWCKQFGLTQRGTLEELKLRLKNYFKN